MSREHPEINFHELLAPNLDAIKETAADMLAFRDRTEALRTSKCILPSTGAPYGYFILFWHRSRGRDTERRQAGLRTSRSGNPIIKEYSSIT
jgi:hypothetical protein